MKKVTIILFLIGLILSQDSFGESLLPQENYSYVLKLQLPAHLKIHSPIPAFYKGMMLELGNNCTLISEKTKSLTFSLVITPEASFESQGNNIRYRRRLPDQPFCWYDVTLRTEVSPDDGNKKTYAWDIKKLNKQEAPLQIPEHAIIMYFAPEFIEKLDEAQTTETSQTSSFISHVIALPPLVIQADIDQEKFDEACDAAWLACLDLRTIHQKMPTDIKQEPQTIISLCKQNH